MNTRPDSFNPYPLQMIPFFSPRPWGGTRLKSVLHKNVPDSTEPIGEAWELSDHRHGRSIIANGPWAGQTFGDLYRAFPLQICGVPHPPTDFPLLIKYIDAESDLSIQVHPDDAMAAAHGDRGKSECWYVMDCIADACVIYGLSPDATPDGLRIAALSGAMEPLIRRCPIRPGDFIIVPPGTVHAILGGTMICEIQQSSDLTYRLWDWNRKPARELHIEDSIRATRFGTKPPHEIVSTVGFTGMHNLLENEYFQVMLHHFGTAARAELALKNPNGLILNVVQGIGQWHTRDSSSSQHAGRFAIGDTWFLPAGLDTLELGPHQDLRLIVSRSLEFVA